MTGARLDRIGGMRLSGCAMALTIALLAACGSDHNVDRPPTEAPPELGVLHAFDGTDGAWSRGSLTAVGSLLYGRTAIGGEDNSGTIFQIDQDGSHFQSLYSFTSGGDNGLGNQPHHNAMLLQGSLLIGAALYGGNTMNSAALRLSEKPPEPMVNKSGNGTLFMIGTDGTDYMVLLGLDGGMQQALPHSPFGSLVLVGDSKTASSSCWPRSTAPPPAPSPKTTSRWARTGRRSTASRRPAA